MRTEEDLRAAMRHSAEDAPHVDDLLTMSRPRPAGRRARAPLAAVAVALVAAVVTAVVAGRHDGRVGSAGRPTPTTDRSPGPARQSDPAADKTVHGYLRAVATNGTSGWVNARDLDGPVPANPRQALAWQNNRGDPTAGYLPVFRTVPTASARPGAVGVFPVGANDVHIPFTCPGNDGIAFLVTPPVNTVGAATALASAPTVKAQYGFDGYDAGGAAWRVVAVKGPSAQVAAGTISLHVRRLANGTWVVVSGQHCLG